MATGNTFKCDDFDITSMLLYKLHKKINNDIEIHKYYVSEKKNFDVGREFAHIDWLCCGHEKNIIEDFKNDIKSR